VVITKVFVVDPLEPDNGAIEYCCAEMKRGAIAVFPTETVYGLGAYVFDVEAVKRIFIVKGRPPDNPLIVHVANIDQVRQVAEEVPNTLRIVFEKLWPGPLTIVLKRRREVPPEISAGLPTVAIRMPGHPVALRLIECVGPIAAPSANLSGRPSPTEPHHVYVDMYGRADIIIDSGATFFGVESTIVDLVSDPPRLLRPGALPVEKISEVLGITIVIPESARGVVESDIALAPGMKYKHYAPRTPLLIVETNNYDNLDAYAKRFAEVVKDRCSTIKCVLIVSRETVELYKDLSLPKIVMGSRSNVYEIAKNLYSVLRELDRLGVDLGIAEGLPEIGLGLTIMNRLRKAAGFNVVKV